MNKYLITGGAGFIGSNIAEHLVKNNNEVVILDNFSHGKKRNINEVLDAQSTSKNLITVIEGDIRDYDTCMSACKDIDYVIHCAALGSVPRSVENPLEYNEVNITGTLNMLEASRSNNVKRFIFSASSSAYGDTPNLPKREEMKEQPKSPYAVNKLTCEYYCKVYNEVYGLETVALRYFNVFGKRQDPDSQYAAVIPKFVASLLKGNAPTIHGDGEQTRDFTYVDNVIEANLKACFADKKACGKVYNIGYGENNSLNELFDIISELLEADIKPSYGPIRAGDVKDSLAAIDLAKEFLNYNPQYDLRSGLEKAITWYKNNL